MSEELTVESIRDEITWSPYAILGHHLGYFIFVTYVLEGISSVTHLAVSIPVGRVISCVDQCEMLVPMEDCVGAYDMLMCLLTPFPGTKIHGLHLDKLWKYLNESILALWSNIHPDPDVY